MKSGRTSGASSSVTKFDSITLSENKVILTKTNKGETTIPSSCLSKIFIKKKRFSFFTKLGLILLILFLIYAINLFLPFEITLFTVIIIFFPLFYWLTTYQWYQLNLMQNDGAFFRKTFHKKKKQEYINLVNRVRSSIFEDHMNSSN